MVLNASGDPQKNTLEAYTSNIEKLNAMIAAAMARVGGSNLPRGTVKVVSVMSGSISLADLARPLVIGYLGFDMAIDLGVSGPPIPTHTVLERGVVDGAARRPGVRLSSTAAIHRVAEVLAGKGDQARRLVGELDALGPIVLAIYPLQPPGRPQPRGP